MEILIENYVRAGCKTLGLVVKRAWSLGRHEIFVFDWAQGSFPHNELTLLTRPMEKWQVVEYETPAPSLTMHSVHDYVVVAEGGFEDRFDLAGFIRQRTPFAFEKETRLFQHMKQKAGGWAFVGDTGMAQTGADGKSKAGWAGIAITGDNGTAEAGDRGQAKAGKGGTAKAGYGGKAKAGEGGTAIAGDHGEAEAGDGGTAISGYRGWSKAGVGGKAAAKENGGIQLSWIDPATNRRRWKKFGVNGHLGVLPGVLYSLDSAGNLIKAE